MGVFDTDLVQKDLPLEDVVRNKITKCVESITWAINDRSQKGTTVFPRLTERGFYGAYDQDFEWCDRYPAFIDYLNVSLKALQKELDEHPLIHDGCKVYIFKIDAFSDYYTNGFNCDPLYKMKAKVLLECRTIEGNFFKRDIKSYCYEFNYDVYLEPPTCPPEGLYFPFVI